MAYYRENENQRVLIAANFGTEAVELPLEYSVKQLILSNMNRTELPAKTIKLSSCEVIVLEF